MAIGERLAFIGAGQIAEALIGGLLDAGVCPRDRIRATDPSAARRDLMASRFGILTGTDNAAAVAWADVVILAVKPQACEPVLAGIRSALKGRLMISVAAGIRLAWLQDRVSEGVRLIRVMPNAPAMVGAGMSALSLHAAASSDDAAVALRVCEAVGRATVVEEPMLDAVTGLSGSGPAYVFAALEAMADGGVKVGLPRDVAERLAVATAAGAAGLFLEHGRAAASRADCGDQVGEPVQAGLAVLDEGDFKRVVAEAVVAAARRSRELGA